MDTTMDTVRQLRQDAAAAVAALPAAHGAERLSLLGVVMDLTKRDVAACAEQRARLQSDDQTTHRELAACIFEQSVAASGAASGWQLLAECGDDPAAVTECRDRARGWLEEAEHLCIEAFFHDVTALLMSAPSPSAPGTA